jgi:hypothetical protein
MEYIVYFDSYLYIKNTILCALGFKVWNSATKNAEFSADSESIKNYSKKAYTKKCDFSSFTCSTANVLAL